MGDIQGLSDLDLSVYTAMAKALRDLADGIETGVGDRRRHGQQAVRQWRGTAVEAFSDRFSVGETDSVELVAALRYAAQLLDGPQETSLVEAGRRENRRRAAGRAWIAKRDQWERDHGKDGISGFFQDVGNWFSADDWEDKIGPMPSGVPEPEPRHEAPVPSSRRGV